VVARRVSENMTMVGKGAAERERGRERERERERGVVVGDVRP